MSKNIIRADSKRADGFDVVGNIMKVQIPGWETGNNFSMVEITSPPGVGSPLHRHNRADQLIFVLEGEIEIFADSEKFSFAKGETCLIRRGTPHTETNLGRSESRFITIHSPGFFSEFVRLAGTQVKAGMKLPAASSPSIEEVRRIAEIGLEFDTEILTPLEELAGKGK